MRDIGLSAYSGANISEGALGKFIASIEQGSVASGSVLIVELLDRLSRQQTSKALLLLLRIVEKGITIATLIDGQTYSDSVDTYQLMMSLVIMQRAHDESLTKSDRLTAVWDRNEKMP